MSSWWGKDDTRDPSEGRDRGVKMITLTAKRKTITKTKQPRTQGDAADAEIQSTWVPSTWQGTGQHTKVQRLGIRMYGSHFSPPDNSPLRMHVRLASFAISVTRHPLADDAPRVYVYPGWHDPYSSLPSPLESKYHIQNHPTRSPTLVGMIKGSGSQMAYG